MSNTRKWVLGLFLGAILAVILLTWGSIASAILTLALILSGIYLLWKRSLEDREDSYWEDGSNG